MREKLKTVPRSPGVYTFRAKNEEVLYIGKAKNLRSRLSSYFQESSGLDQRKAAMVKEAADFSFIATGNELEALILEANLIKQHRPGYNIILRDDKNYPYLKITMKEQWPRIEIVRRVVKDGSLYFGPYVPSGSMKEALSVIRKNFLIRPCGYTLDKPMRPCIQYQMGKCGAPCAGLVERADYMNAVNEAVMFLKGKNTELLDNLDGEMKRLSEETRYEEAAEIRDRIESLKRAFESQRVIAPELGDMDVIGFCKYAKDASFQVLFIRNGVMIGARNFFLKSVSDTPDAELMHSFIETFYSKGLMPPSEILVRKMPEDAGSMGQWLSGLAGEKVSLSVPKRGKRLGVLSMAEDNARISMESRTGGGLALSEIRKRLRLSRIPDSIGAFDISNIGGSEPVGAFIWWENGDFIKDRYRRIKIKSVSGIDDYAMMAEAVKRTLDGIEPPDLIIIDGGRGHLESVWRSLKGVKMRDIISIAKKPDRAYTLEQKEAVKLAETVPWGLLLIKIRNEVHRFAISYHKKLRSKRFLSSRLETIKGVGEKRRLELLRKFGSIEAIKKASSDEIAGTPGIGPEIAKLVKTALTKNSENM